MLSFFQHRLNNLYVDGVVAFEQQHSFASPFERFRSSYF